jgi:hypothetical protein
VVAVSFWDISVLRQDIETSMDGLLHREAVMYIAGLLGGFATESNTGGVVISPIGCSTVAEVDAERTTEMYAFGDYNYTVNGIKVLVSSGGETEDGETVDEVSYVYGTPNLTLSNPYMTKALFDLMAPQITGYTYRPGTIPVSMGDIRLEAGDVVTVRDTAGESYTVPCLNLVHTYDGGLMTTITAPGASTTEQEAAFTGSLAATVKQTATELLVAKKVVATKMEAVEADVGKLVAENANINSLLAGSAGVGTLQAIHLTSDNVVIDDATITSAMIADLAASKITSGTLNTSKVAIQSDSGNLIIKDNTIQMADKSSVVRVQIGEDGNGDYNLYLWDTDGNLLWDAGGVTSSGLNDGIIKDVNVAADAAIAGSKLDIASVAEKLNEDGSITVDSSQVTVDDTTLAAAYKTLTQQVTDVATTSSTLKTELEVVQGQIESKVWQTDITNAVNPISGDVETLRDQYTAVAQTVDSIQVDVGDVKTTVNDNYKELDDRIATISATADGITTTVSSLQSKIDNRSYENRNYILLSGDYEAGGETGWACESTTAAQYLSITTYDGYTQLKKVKTHSGTTFYLMEIDFSQELENNAEYTLSMRVRPSVAANLFTVLKTASGSKKTLNTFSSSLFTANEWTEISYTFTTDSASYVKLCINEPSINSVGRTLDIAWAKLEKGSEVTNWSRAPEDYATNISVESKIEQLADSITLSVSGGLGDTATIKLAVGDEEQTKTLDMSDIRQKFAEDTSSVTVSGGTVTFEAGKLLINGGNFTLDENGTMTATNGNFIGTITAKSGTIGKINISSSADKTVHYATNSLYTQATNAEIKAFDPTSDDDSYVSVNVDAEIGMKPISSITDQFLYARVKKTGDSWKSSADGSPSPLLFGVTGYGNLRCSGITIYPNRPLQYYDDELSLIDSEAIVASTDDDYLNLYNVKFGYQAVASDIDPVRPNEKDLGGSDYYWRRIYVGTIYRKSEATLSTSDRKRKENFRPLDESFKAFLMRLNPATYTFKGGTGRRHMGFVAQDVADAAKHTVGDVAAFTAHRNDIENDTENRAFDEIDDEHLDWYLDYEELIAPMVAVVQEQERRINKLEEVISKLLAPEIQDEMGM